MNFFPFFAFSFQTMVHFTSLVVADDANRIMFSLWKNSFEDNWMSSWLPVILLRLSGTTVTTGKNFRIIHVNLNFRRMIDSQLHGTIFNIRIYRTEKRYQRTVWGRVGRVSYREELWRPLVWSPDITFTQLLKSSCWAFFAPRSKPTNMDQANFTLNSTTAPDRKSVV